MSEPDAFAQFLEDAHSIIHSSNSYIIPGVGIVRVTVEFEPMERDDD